MEKIKPTPGRNGPREEDKDVLVNNEIDVLVESLFV